MGSSTHPLLPAIMNRCPIHIVLPILAILLPYTSTLNLPSGDPAPGRSPGPPDQDLFELEQIDDIDTTTEVTVDVDACDYARFSSDGDLVTLSEKESEVNFTVSHPVFDVAELVRGVVYDGTFCTVPIQKVPRKRKSSYG